MPAQTSQQATRGYSELQAGAPAPDFDLPTDDGNRIQLSQFSGRQLVVYFYPKDLTAGCTRQAVNFTDRIGDFDTADTAIVGISPDNIARHQKFRAANNLGVILASDEDKQAAQTYGVWVEKKMYGRSYMGIVRTSFLIDRHGVIAEIWRNVRVNGHVDAVLEAARQLNDGAR